MNVDSISAYVKELEDKVKRYEELLDVLARPGNVSALNMKDVQRWAECVYDNKERIVNWSCTEPHNDLDVDVCDNSNCGCSNEGC